jgi:hypothetical protein
MNWDPDIIQLEPQFSGTWVGTDFTKENDATRASLGRR